MNFSEFFPAIKFIGETINKYRTPKIVGFNITNLKNKIINSLYEEEASEEYCHKTISHSLIIENPSDREIVIDSIELSNVKVDSSYSFSDIKFHCGLNQENQNFKIFIFNNGNRQSTQKIYTVRINRKVHDSSEQRIEEVSNNIDSLKGGDIRNLINLKLKKLQQYFDDSHGQILEFQVFCDDKKVYENVLLFDESSKTFHVALGGGPGESQIAKNYFSLVKPYNSNYKLPINENIPAGENSICFDILIDATCQLSYDINVRYRGKVVKPIENIILSNSVNIREYYYKDKSLYKGLAGSIYYYCEKHEFLDSEFREVKRLEKDLLA